jgi:hypothetical protein
MAKKTRQNAIRVSSDLFELGRKMMCMRGAENFSEYVRGLLLLDAVNYSRDLPLGHDIPGWVTKDNRFQEAMSRVTEVREPHRLGQKGPGPVG